MTKTVLQGCWNVKHSPLKKEVQWIYFMWLLVTANLLRQLKLFIFHSDFFKCIHGFKAVKAIISTCKLLMLLFWKHEWCTVASDTVGV